MYKINVFCDNGLRTSLTVFSPKFGKYYNFIYEPFKKYRLFIYSMVTYLDKHINKIKTNIDAFVQNTNKCDTLYTSLFNNTSDDIEQKLLIYKNLFDKRIYDNFVFIVEEERPTLKDFMFTMGYKYGYKYFKDELLDFQCYNSPNNQKVFVCFMSVNNPLTFKYNKREKKQLRYNIKIINYISNHPTLSVSQLPKNRIIINYKRCPPLPSLRNEGWDNIYIKHGNGYKHLKKYMYGSFNCVGYKRNRNYGHQGFLEMIPYKMSVSIFKNIRNHLL